MPTGGLILRQPDEADAAVVCGWSLSAQETTQWCASKTHPVTASQVVEWWLPSDVEPFVAVSGNLAPLAYGELWLEAEEDEVELARLIVAPRMRGRGVGRQLVAALVDKGALTGLSTVILRVTPGNDAALHCYRDSGFRELDERRNAEWNKGQPATYTWMELAR